MGSVVEWLKCRDRDQYGLDSKPIRTILLSPWEKHFTLNTFPRLVVLAGSSKLKSYLIKKNFKQTAIFSHLRKQVGLIAYPNYNASSAFLQIRRINKEIKKNFKKQLSTQLTD